MAEQVIRTFDLYNTSVLLPGYNIPGYEKQFDLTRGYYSTDFSSNPIGSKVDFFVQMDDPCVGVLTPNPVFTVPVGLSGLDPLWFDQWWDEAMFYSHPKVLEQLQASNPATYQPFSDSVGTFFYVSEPSSPVSPALNSKIPKNILDRMTRLNALVNVEYRAYTPAGFGPNTSRATSQLAQYTKSIAAVKNIVNKKFDSIKRKLPLNVTQTGNLITPANWKFDMNLQGVKTAVDRLGNIISAPGRALSGAINKIKSLIPVIKLPKLPSIGKLINANIPGMATVSNLYAGLKTAASAVQSAVATAQGALAATQSVIAAAKNTVGAVQSAVTSVKGTVQALSNAANTAGSALTNINKVITKGNVTAAMKNQSSTATTGLNNNAVVLVNSTIKNSRGNSSVTPVNTFNYKKPTV